MTREQRFRALAAVPEFRAIAADALSALAAGMREERFAAGEVVILANEAADRVFVLCEGLLEVTHEALILRRLEPGALLGELAFFAGTARTATVRAVEPCAMLSLHFDNFRAFLLRYPEIMLILTGRIVRSLLEVERRLADQ